MWKLNSILKPIKSTAALPGQITKTALTEEFVFQNVAYIPTVYRTGSHTLLILQISTTFKDVQMILKWFFDISTGFRFSKISVGVSVHIYSCPCLNPDVKNVTCSAEVGKFISKTVAHLF